MKHSGHIASCSYWQHWGDVFLIPSAARRAMPCLQLSLRFPTFLVIKLHLVTFVYVCLLESNEHVCLLKGVLGDIYVLYQQGSWQLIMRWSQIYVNCRLIRPVSTGSAPIHTMLIQCHHTHHIQGQGHRQWGAMQLGSKWCTICTQQATNGCRCTHEAQWDQFRAP